MMKMRFRKATQFLGVIKAIATAGRDAIMLETTHQGRENAK